MKILYFLSEKYTLIMIKVWRVSSLAYWATDAGPN